MAAPDSAGPCMHRGSQAQRPQVRPVEDAEEVRQSLTTTRTENRNQAFRAGQLADRESMASLLERGQVIYRPLLIGGIAFDGVDDDHGVQVVKHSRPPRRGRATRSVQFPVPLRILIQARILFGAQFCC